MLSDRLRGLAQHIRMQTQQHPATQEVLAHRLRGYAEMAKADGASALAERLGETAISVDQLAAATPWQPMTTTERGQLANFLELAADTAERAEGHEAAGGAA